MTFVCVIGLRGVQTAPTDSVPVGQKRVSGGRVRQSQGCHRGRKQRQTQLQLIFATQIPSALPDSAKAQETDSASAHDSSRANTFSATASD